MNVCEVFVVSNRVVFNILGNVAVPQKADQIVEYLRDLRRTRRENRDERSNSELPSWLLR